MTLSLKPDSQRVYQFIQAFIEDRGFPPTHREIADACFMARSNVQRHLDILEAKGLIQREMGRARSLSLIPRSGETTFDDTGEDRQNDDI